MKISSKGRCALHIMADIAENGSNGCISAKDISQRQGISVKYMEQILPHLTRAGLLHSERGAQGGYRLTRAPEQYTTLDILRAVAGDAAPVTHPPQTHRTQAFWEGMNRAMQAYAESVTLRDLMPTTDNRRRTEPAHAYLLD